MYFTRYFFIYFTILFTNTISFVFLLTKWFVCCETFFFVFSFSISKNKNSWKIIIKKKIINVLKADKENWQLFLMRILHSMRRQLRLKLQFSGTRLHMVLKLAVQVSISFNIFFFSFFICCCSRLFFFFVISSTCVRMWIHLEWMEQHYFRLCHAIMGTMREWNKTKK